jgi:hypothetical protein
MQTSTLRPGLLVSLKTSLRGNVKYSTTDLGTTVTVDGAEEARWETNRHIADKAELERATKARSKARSVVSGVCAQSAFGLLCLESRRDELETAIMEAEAIARDFNASAALSRLSFNVVVGVIAPDDARAVRAINSEMSDLLANMAEGMKNLNPQAIRDAANRARSVGQMLTSDMQAKVADAINVARQTAREMIKAAEVGVGEVDRLAIAKIADARTAFLDLDEQGTIGEVEHQGRAVELAPEPTGNEGVGEPAPVQTRMFEV